MAVLRAAFLALTIFTYMFAGVKCEIKIMCDVTAVVDDAENLGCSSKCADLMESMWFGGVLYYRIEKLSIRGKMAKITFNNNQMVSCEVVDARTDASLEEHQMRCEEGAPVTAPPQPCCWPVTTPAYTCSPPPVTIPDETTFASATPTETTPAETTPAEATSAETTPAETTPAETTPAETTPAETTPAETTPAETTPAETTPAETTPAETTPAETTPAETTPAETTPAEATSAETTPAETTPAETTPAEATSTKTTPAETTPAETTPALTTPGQTTPSQTTSVPTTSAPITPSPTTHAPAESTSMDVSTTSGSVSTDSPTTGLTTAQTKSSTASRNTTSSSSAGTTTIPGELMCPPDWKIFGSSCFLMSSEDEEGNRASGKRYCEQAGGQLASIRSEEENNFIIDNFEFEEAWIGLNDREEEGNFQWEDSATYNYSNWGRNEPNNFGFFGEDCVEITEEGTWNDEGCSVNRRRYLCRREAEWTPGVL